jgi:hypothetical protein
LTFGLFVTIFVGALGGALPATAANISEREPNNTPDTAQTLPVITFASTHKVTGFSGNTGYDWYRVNITDNHELQFYFRSSDTSAYRYVLLYHDRNGNSVLDEKEFYPADYVDIGSGDSVGGKTYKGMPDGYYYFQVFSNNSTAYTLQVTANTSRPTQKEYEPKNNNAATANVVQGYITGYRYLEGSMNGGPNGAQDRYDHFRFSISTYHPTVNIILSNLDSTTYLRLYQDKNGDGRLNPKTELIASDIGYAGSFANINRPVNNGTYILQILKPYASGSTFYNVTLGAY